jgi:hypothetical protein
MSQVVIDLGEVPDHRDAPAGTPAARPPVPYRALLGALSIVLLVMVAGSAVRPAPEAPTIIAARLGDTTYLSGDLLFVVGTGGVDTGSAVRERVISTYHLPETRLLSRTTIEIAGSVVGVEQAGGTLVVGYQLDASGSQEVVAQTVGAGPGGSLWHRAARLIAVSAADGIALLSADGGDIAVDLRTGALHWRVARPNDGFVAETGVGVGYPNWLVVLTGSGRLETWDAHTGRRLGAATMPGRADPITGMIWPVSDLLLVATGDSGYDGYRLPELRRLWHTPVDLSRSWTQSDCGQVICTFRQQRGMTVLDPATGRLLWDSERWAYAEPLGPYLLATAGAEDTEVPALWVLDPRTGRVLGDFGGWQGLGPAGDSGKIYGKRDVVGQYKVFYGLLDPATHSVEPLGLAERVSGGCETGGGVMTCRLIDASVAVWRLR